MKDMQSAVKAPLVQAPIAYLARRLLACDSSVKAVMAVGYHGEVLAHERTISYSEDEATGLEESSLMYYVPTSGVLFYVRLNNQPKGDRLPLRIQAMINSPTSAITV